MPNLDDEAAKWERVEFARQVARATPKPTYPGQPWEIYDIGEIGGELVCLWENVAPVFDDTACFRYLGPLVHHHVVDALNMDTLNVLPLDRVRRLSAAELCAHPLTGPAIAAVALAVGLGDAPDPVSAVQAWQETWED